MKKVYKSLGFGLVAVVGITIFIVDMIKTETERLYRKAAGESDWQRGHPKIKK